MTEGTTEREFALALERMDEVKLLVKLPGWFTVCTPIGQHNPDWANILQRQDPFGEPTETFYFVRETKGALDHKQRRAMENIKITCARGHFETLDVKHFDVVVGVEALLSKH